MEDISSGGVAGVGGREDFVGEDVVQAGGVIGAGAGDATLTGASVAGASGTRFVCAFSLNRDAVEAA